MGECEIRRGERLFRFKFWYDEFNLPYVSINERKTFSLFGRPLFQYWDELKRFWTEESRVKAALDWLDERLAAEEFEIEERKEVEKFCAKGIDKSSDL